MPHLGIKRMAEHNGLCRKSFLVLERARNAPGHANKARNPRLLSVGPSTAKTNRGARNIIFDFVVS